MNNDKNKEIKIQISKGLRSKYFNDDGLWDSSNFLGVIYFAVDTKEIFVDGTSFGFSQDESKKIQEKFKNVEETVNKSEIKIKNIFKHQLNDTEVSLSSVSNVGGLLSKAKTVSEALALIDDSVSWQYFDNCYLEDPRVSFSMTGKESKGTQGTEGSGRIEFSTSEHTVYVNGEKFGTVDKKGNDIEEHYLSKKQFKDIMNEIMEGKTDIEDIRQRIDSL